MAHILLGIACKRRYFQKTFSTYSNYRFGRIRGNGTLLEHGRTYNVGSGGR